MDIPAPTNQWEYFQCGADLVLQRWTALRMAMEGEWGGGDMVRKFELFRDLILNEFKYNKNVYLDDLAVNIEDHLEEQFNLVCEDGSVDEVCKVLIEMADECKQGKFDRVQQLRESVQQMQKIDLKAAKVENDFEQAGMSAPNAAASASTEPEPMNEGPDEDGWCTVPVRRSGRKKNQPQFYDPEIEFPGAQ